MKVNLIYPYLKLLAPKNRDNVLQIIIFLRIITAVLHHHHQFLSLPVVVHSAAIKRFYPLLLLASLFISLQIIPP